MTAGAGRQTVWLIDLKHNLAIHSTTRPLAIAWLEVHGPPISTTRCEVRSSWALRSTVPAVQAMPERNINNYRWRLGPMDGEPRYNELQQRLAAAPDITVSAITLEGDANGAPHADPSAYFAPRLATRPDDH